MSILYPFIDASKLHQKAYNTLICLNVKRQNYPDRYHLKSRNIQKPLSGAQQFFESECQSQSVGGKHHLV